MKPRKDNEVGFCSNAVVYVVVGIEALEKSTRADVLADHLNVPHINAEYVLREKAKKDKNISKALKQGNIIPEDKVFEIIYERMCKVDCKKGFVLSGYPNNLVQSDKLFNFYKMFEIKNVSIVQITMSDDIILERVLSGISDPNGNITLKTWFNNVSSNSGNIVEKVKQKIEDYDEQIYHIVENYYMKGWQVIRIDGSSDPEEILDEIF